MTGRIIAALDTGMRRGEMLLLQNKHILWGEDLIRVVAANPVLRPGGSDVFPSRPLVYGLCLQLVETMVPAVGVEPTRGVNLTGF